MAGSALKRLMAEYKRKCDLFFVLLTITKIVFFSELTLNPPEGIIAGPTKEENFFEWDCLIT